MTSISKIIEVLLFLQVLYEGSYSEEDCNPYTKCEVNNPGYKPIDPTDCHNYYICITEVDGKVVPSDHIYQCNSGSYYNEISQQCFSGSCTNTCVNRCSITCTTYNFERVADPDDCTAFYTCRPGNIKVKGKCPSDAPYFNGDKCTNTEYSCCDSCFPYCEEAYTEVLDPFDCRSYYMCINFGQPSESNKYSCPDSQYFDPSLAACTPEDPNSPCTSLCTKKPSTGTTIGNL